MMTLRQGLEKRAFLDAVLGTIRAANLTDEEKGQLKKKYGLKDDANLVLRNTGRGAAGGALGILASSPAVLAMLMYPGKVPQALPGLTMNAASLVGAKLMTDKYSKSALDS